MWLFSLKPDSALKRAMNRTLTRVKVNFERVVFSFPLFTNRCVFKVINIIHRSKLDNSLPGRNTFFAQFNSLCYLFQAFPNNNRLRYSFQSACLQCFRNILLPHGYDRLLRFGCRTSFGYRSSIMDYSTPTSVSGVSITERERERIQLTRQNFHSFGNVLKGPRPETHDPATS